MAKAVPQDGAFPYELAFDRGEFVSGILAVSPEGNRVAYAVRHKSPETNLMEGRSTGGFVQKGTPRMVQGTKVYITNREDGSTVDVCPGDGNAWRPSWSPNGQSLAFYSDADGPPQLWVYELSEGNCRKVSSAVIKAKHWAGDEAQWGPNSRTVYVPLAPEQQRDIQVSADAEANHAGTRSAPREGPAVTVLRSGSEMEELPKEIVEELAKAGPMKEHFLRVNNASMAAIDVRTGEVRVLASAETEPRPSVLRLSASGRWLTYLSVYRLKDVTSQKLTMDLAVLPATGGGVRVLAKGLPVLRDYYRLNYSWHPTEDRLVYLKENRLWLVDFGPEGPSAPRQLAPELGELAPTMNWFTQDGQSVVVRTAPKNDQGIHYDAQSRGLGIVPLDGGKTTRLSFDEDRWTYLGILKADARTVWQPDGVSITLQLRDRATGEKGIVRIDPRTGRSKVLWKGRARFGNLTASGTGNFIFGTYEDYSTAPDVYRFSSDFSQKKRVSNIEPRLNGVAVGKAEVFETSVPLHDGRLEKVRTGVLLPPGAKRGDRLPAIVMFYPGSDYSSNIERFGGGNQTGAPALLFTSRGYAVVLPHVKLGRGDEPGNVIQEMVDVLMPQVYRAAELGYVDVERLALRGQSFGGFATAAIVSQTNLFRAAVASNGPYDLGGGSYGRMYGELKQLSQASVAFGIGWTEGRQPRLGTHPWANLRRYIENSPYYRADRIFTPLLIVQGGADKYYVEAEKLFTALRRLDRPAQLAIYAGEGHFISAWTRANAIDASQRMMNFYRKHLGDPGASDNTGGNR